MAPHARAAGPEAQPAVANGVVYISDGDQEGTLYALDASTGNKLASLQAGTPIEASNAVVVNGTVYIGGFDRQLHAFALPPARAASGPLSDQHRRDSCWSANRRDQQPPPMRAPLLEVASVIADI